MRRSLPNRGWWIVAGAGLLAGVWLAWGRLAAGPADPGARASSPAEPPPVAAPAPLEAPPSEPAPDPLAFRDDAPDLEAPLGDPGIPWGIVDLEEIRRALPRNLYWQTAMPTTEPRALQERADERARWNVEYGKMLSGTGSEQEIEAYYAHRQRLSADYVEFVGYLLDHYGEKLPERDVGLLELARRLHLARLEELARQMQRAFDRKRAQDEARAAWLADEAAFDPAAPKR